MRDWVKMRTDLYRDPKVIAMAMILEPENGELGSNVRNVTCNDMCVTRNVIRNAVVGCLVTVWGIARHDGKRIEQDSLLESVTIEIIDELADLAGFGAAMASVGWIVETDDGCLLPCFFEGNNESPAKKTMTNAERQREYRARQKQKDTPEPPLSKGVTKRNATVTKVTPRREEEKREEKSISTNQLASAGEAAKSPMTFADSWNQALKVLPERFQTEAYREAFEDWDAVYPQAFGGGGGSITAEDARLFCKQFANRDMTDAEALRHISDSTAGKWKNLRFQDFDKQKAIAARVDAKSNGKSNLSAGEKSLALGKLY